jgi:hypothetical protein
MGPQPKPRFGEYSSARGYTGPRTSPREAARGVRDAVIKYGGLTDLFRIEHRVAERLAPYHPAAKALAETTGKLGVDKAGEVNELHAAGNAVLFFTGPLKALGAVGKGAKAALTGKGAKATVAAAREGHRAPIRSLPRRVYKWGNLRVPMPAAKARTGRLVESLGDAIRPQVARTGLMKTAEGKAARELGYTAEQNQRIRGVYATRLKQVGRKLNDEQEYALRVLAEGMVPSTRAAQHRLWATQASEAGEELAPQAIYHGIHADLSEQANQYISQTLDGQLVLAETAPRALHEAWDLFQQAGDLRETLLSDLGRLGDEQIANRIHAPGRVYSGARYRKTEDMVKEALANSPIRAQAFQHFDRVFQDPAPRAAAKALFDAQIRSAAQRMSGDPQALSALLSRIRGIEDDIVALDHLPPDINVLYQQTPPLPVPKMVAINREAIGNHVRSNFKLPPKLRGAGEIEGAIERFEALARAGAPWRDWYQRYAGVMTKAAADLGIPPRKFAQLVAIYSPRANPTENFRRALMFVKDNSFLAIGKEPQREKALKILEDPDWFEREFLPAAEKKSPKVKNYYLNALEDIDPALYEQVARELPVPVTIDTHMVNAFMDDITGEGGVSNVYYEGLAEVFRKMGDQYGWKPKEVQAAVWVAWKAKNEQHRVLERGKNVKPWEEYMPNASDAYERGYDKYKGTLFQGMTPEELEAFNAQMMGEAFNARTLSNDIPELGPEANEAVKQGVADTLGESGGHTWNGDMTSDLGTDGFAVSVEGHEMKIPASRFDETDVAQFWRERKALLDQDPSLKVGSWRDGDDVYLDLTKIVQEKDTALRVGQFNGQRAIYDRAAGENIDVPLHVPTRAPYLVNPRTGEFVLGNPGDQHFDVHMSAIKGGRNIGDFGELQQGDIALVGDQAKLWQPTARKKKTGAEADELDPQVEAALREEAMRRFPEDTKIFYQRGGSLEGVSPWGVRGYAAFDPESAIIGLTTAADETTLFHELAHVTRRFALTDSEEKRLAKWAGAENGVWDRDAEEKFAKAVEVTIRSGEGPTPVKQALRSLAPIFREAIDMADMPDVPPHVAKMIQGLFQFERARGGKLVGAEDILVGQAYAPVVRGMPIKLTDPQRAFAAYNRRLTAYFSAGRKTSIGAGPDDKALRKSYEGSLLLSGFFKRDVIGPKVDSAILANRMAGAAQARRDLLEAATELPNDPTDIPIKIDPSKDAPAGLAPMLERLRQLEAGEKLGAQHLETVDMPMMEAARELLFPSRIGDESALEAAARVLETQSPIDNILWLDKAALERTQFLHVPRAGQAMVNGLPQLAKSTAKVAGISWDGLNDFQRAMILYLNPAYAPMQLVGNLGMNLLQQGVFMPVNLWKAVMMHWDMEPLDRLTVDAAMGLGAANAISMRTGPGKMAQATLGHWANLAADLIPRRSAFLHEVRRAKIEDLPGLLKAAREGDEAALGQMDELSRRAKRAIVDFDRLSPFEREVISRYIFFYPWLRGATDYSINFIADHPVLAAGMALAYEHLKVAQDEQIGERPRYSELDVPISTRSVGLRVPFTDLDASLASLVDKTWMTDDVRPGHEGEQLPMVFKLRQALTQTTPMELTEEMIAFVTTGDRETAALVAQHLTPVPYAAGVSLFGYDPFKQREVDPGLKTFFGEFGPLDAPLGARAQAITMSDKEREERNEKALYPRERKHEAWRLGLGSLAPTPYDPEIGQERAAQRARERMPLVERRRAEFDDDVKALGMEGDIPQRVYTLLDKRSELDEELEDGMPYSERLVVLGNVIGMHQPELPEPAAERRYRALREVYFGPLNAYERLMDKRIDAKLGG